MRKPSGSEKGDTFLAESASETDSESASTRSRTRRQVDSASESDGSQTLHALRAMCRT